MTSLILLGLLLTACGRSGNVVTQDDSADYSSARSLPPLKKPGSPTITANPQADAPAPAPAPPSSPEPTVVAAKPAPAARGVASATVVEAGNDDVVLQLNGDVDSAWSYLRRNLKKSDITVHTRNKSAGRFSIGCAGIDGEENVEVSKKGGWSIFKRTRDESEHCALQLIGKKDVAEVRIYNRSGQPVSPEISRALFARLLNN